MRYFVYGSLRDGEYNNYILKDSLYLGLALIKGFKMLSFGSYPAIVKSDNKDDVVIGDVYDITDKEIIRRIDNMEAGAGYEKEKVKVEYISRDIDECFVYVYPFDTERHSMLVNGVNNISDWKQRNYV